MARSIYDKLLARYREYAGSEEAAAVLFVKLHLADARGHWIDPSEFRRYEMSPDDLHFRFVYGELYARTTLPKYPDRSGFMANGRFDERRYMSVARAITWDTAHQDMEKQKAAGVKGVKFEVTGVSYDRNRSSNGFFRDDAPLEIKALARNLQDRTDPLWDQALKYASAPEFVFEIRRARILGVLNPSDRKG